MFVTTSSRVTVQCGLAVALAIGWGLAGSAHADVQSAVYVSGAFFDYEIWHMPDLDQRRAAASGIVGLPNNGAMYCVPTSSMNMITYAANHGFPSIPPGAGNYQSNALYNTAGTAIDALGDLMGTDPNNGTDGNGWFTGTFVWLFASNKFVVTQGYASGYYSPTLAKLAKTACAGNLVSFAYGRYDLVADANDVLQVAARTGGHAVTLTAAGRIGSTAWISYRDPANDSADLYAQSAFGNNEPTVRDHIVLGPDYWRVMTSLNHPWNDDRARLIDGYVAIRPKAGYSFVNTGTQVVNWLQPIKLLGFTYPDTTSFDSPTGTPILDVLLHPDGADLLVLCEGAAGGPRTLHSVDMLTRETTEIPLPPFPRKIFFGRMRELYVLCDGSVNVLNLELPNPFIAAEVPPNPCDALTFDDAADQVVLLSVAGRKILKYRAGLGVPPSTFDIPTPVPLMGDGSVSINPLDGKIWLATAASDSLFGLQIGGAGIDVEEINLPAVQQPTSLDFDDAGHMFVIGANGLVELHNPTGRTWEVVPSSDFAGLPVGSMLRMTRSRTNFDPTTMSGPGFFNIDPSEVEAGSFSPDALGDMNCDGVVDFQDINPFVMALTNPDLYERTYTDCYLIHGDINTDGVVGFGDINPFVALLTGSP